MNRLPLATPLWELIGLAALLGAYLAGSALFEQAGYEFMNFIGPIWLAAVLSLGALRMMRADTAAVWTPLFWFRVSSVAYYGFGSIVPLISDEATRAYIRTFFRFYGADLAKANVIFVAAVLVVLISANASLLVIGQGRAADRQMRSRTGGRMLAAGLLFLGVGATIKYLFVVPYIFGITDFVLPGSVATLGNFTLVAIFLLTAWSRENAKTLLPLPTAFAAMEMLVGLVAFNKSAVLATLMMYLLAFLWTRATPLRLVVSAAIVVLAYGSMIPLVSFGRAELWDRYGSLGGAGFTERLEILSSAFGSTLETDPVARGMSRISYMNQATFAVHEYDSLRPGHSFVNVLAVFVPRALWPDKPIMTQLGSDFNAAATGNPNSSSSPGLFAEAYWNFGWAGVVLVMTALGLILAILSRYALRVVQHGLWFYFPVVLLAVRMGFRTDGYFVVDVAGAAVLALALHILLVPLDRALRPVGQERRAIGASRIAPYGRSHRTHYLHAPARN